MNSILTRLQEYYECRGINIIIEYKKSEMAVFYEVVCQKLNK